MFKNRKDNGPDETAPATPAATTQVGAPEPTPAVQPFRPIPRASAPAEPPRAPAPATFPAQAPRPQTPSRLAGPSDKRTLVVGRGITVSGSVQDAERLVVEGTVEASSLRAIELAVAEGGVLKGDVEVEEAEIAGFVDGTLTTSGVLLVRATGRLVGTARCRRLQVEDGGEISGKIEMTTTRPNAPSRPAVAVAAAAPAPAPAPNPAAAPSPATIPNPVAARVNA